MHTKDVVTSADEFVMTAPKSLIRAHALRDYERELICFVMLYVRIAPRLAADDADYLAPAIRERELYYAAVKMMPQRCRRCRQMPRAL